MIPLDFSILTALTALLALFVACGVGANDVANAMGTSVGARVLTIKQAIAIAAIFEGLGALLASDHVTNTISSGVIDLSYYHQHPETLILGMFAALLAVGCWLVIATYFSWPVSTTHSIIGALIGYGLLTAGTSHIHWSIIGYIFGSWVVTPLASGLIAFALFYSVKKLIFDSDHPTVRAASILPIYIFIVAIIIFYMGLENIRYLFHHHTAMYNLHLSLGLAMLTALISGIQLKNRLKKDPSYGLESLFGILAIFTACAMAFAHGSNDTANAIGPAATILKLIHPSISHTPWWLTAIGAFGVMAGLGIYGYRVIATIGNNITELTPSRSFAAQLATASTVLLSSAAGLPVSTTQILIGGVLGVGLARGISAINLGVVRTILMSWIVTLPAGAGLTCIFFVIFKHFLA